ncbi:MAG: T9SS type A sorting domain-containing protein [Calditrichaeota bacterium]|nr:T9SS type A sorting domain-containing protein [Calditrichota bacterium]
MRKVLFLLLALVLAAVPLQAQEHGAVAGQVVGADGGAIGGAVVTLFMNNQRIGETVSNDEGRFGFERVPTGVGVAWAVARDIGQGSARVEVAAGQVSNITITINVQNGGGDAFGRVVGRVVNQEGAPWAGAHVTLAGNQGVVQQTRTNNEGHFAFDRVPPGVYECTAVVEGVGRASQRVESVRAGVAEVRLVIAEDDNGGGGGDDDQFGRVVGIVLTADGAAVSGAAVHLFRENDLALRTGTDGHGRFVFERVPAGDYRIIAAHDRFGRADGEVAVEGGGVAEIRLVLQNDNGGGGDDQFGRVVGRVTDPEGNAFAGAAVVLHGVNGIAMRTGTDGQGAFVFERVPAGVYEIVADAGDHGRAGQRIDVEAGAVVEVHLVIEGNGGGGDDQPGRVVGQVVNADGQPLGGVRVFLVGINHRFAQERQADREGRFVFERVPAGLYNVGADAGDHGHVIQQIEVAAGAVVEVRLVLGRNGGGGGDDEQRYGRVSGVVVDGEGNPIEGAIVTLENDRHNAETATGEDGHFLFPWEPVGHYLITATAEDVGDAVARIGIRAGLETVVRLVIHNREGLRPAGDPEAVNPEVTPLPLGTGLVSVYPTPFNPAATVTVVLPIAASGRVALYDLHGRAVQTLYEGTLQAGRSSFSLPGRNLDAGLYIVSAETSVGRFTARAVLVR